MKKGAAMKMYIVKKYIMASSASQAILKEKKVKPDDVWVDDEWRKANKDNLASAIGFMMDAPKPE